MLLQGKRGLLVGIANERSIAFGIAKAIREHGGHLILTYQNERLATRVEALGSELQAELVLPCELTDATQLSQLVDRVTKHWGALDFVVHAVAFAKREELEGRFIDTSSDGFNMALDVSVYSFVSLLRYCEPLLKKGNDPAALTLSYYGGRKVVPNYNVMGVAKAALEAAVRYLAVDLGPHGIRVNALSPGPIKTLSAAGVRGLRDMLKVVEATAPLRRNITIDDVGRAAVFAISNLAGAITGEIVHVDAGYNIMGAPRVNVAESTS